MLDGSGIAQVLLALDQRDGGQVCLKRAVEMTFALRAELRVIRVLPKRSRVRAWWGRGPDAREEVRGALKATRLWLARSLGEEPPVGKVVVRCGRFVEAVSEHVRFGQPELVVLPPFIRRVGTVATMLARRTGAKVLVAHDPGHRKAILAATDLSNPRFPVLEEAARLGLALEAPVTALHNVDPLGAFQRYGVDRGVARAQLSRILGPTRLLDGVQLLPDDSSAVMRAEIDPVAAILDEARRRDVDLLVVGVHDRRPFERWLHGSVAARVIQRSDRSVLVMPMP